MEFIKSCQDKESGGISASVGHDPHILYTLSAVQILSMYDKIDVIDVEGVIKYITSLQLEDGSFMGIYFYFILFWSTYMDFYCLYWYLKYLLRLYFLAPVL